MLDLHLKVCLNPWPKKERVVDGKFYGSRLAGIKLII